MSRDEEAQNGCVGSTVSQWEIVESLFCRSPLNNNNSESFKRE